MVAVATGACGATVSLAVGAGEGDRGSSQESRSSPPILESLIIISPAGIEYERIVYEGKLTPRYLLKRLGRENLIKDLRSMGAQVIDWTPDKDLTWVLQEVWR